MKIHYALILDQPILDSIVVGTSESETDVSDLRRAVHEANKTKLQYIDANDLIVHGPQPKAAFSNESIANTLAGFDEQGLDIERRISSLINGEFKWFAVLVPPRLDQAVAQRFQPSLQQHQNVEEGVFVLYRGDDSDAEPIGTAFAISTNLLLTACHNVVFESNDGKHDMVTDLKIAIAIEKTEGKFAAVTSRKVSVHRYCIPVDWAALKLHDDALALPFVIPMATANSDMPPRATLEKLYIYHCPVGLFLEDDDIDRLHVTLKEASVGVINTKTLTYQNGAFPGSSGGPYIFRNKAVALHTESVSTTKTAEDIRAEASAAGRKRKMPPVEVALKVADSCVSSHTSLGSGIMLHVRSGIMRLLDEA